ncbi:MAG: hypothetical protein MZV63_49235 [Marinilabiliales bacterium]|nr:hypothetical protein [Marinilabiliales bacterium]
MERVMLSEIVEGMTISDSLRIYMADISLIFWQTVHRCSHSSCQGTTDLFIHDPLQVITHAHVEDGARVRRPPEPDGSG